MSPYVMKTLKTLTTCVASWKMSWLGTRWLSCVVRNFSRLINATNIDTPHAQESMTQVKGPRFSRHLHCREFTWSWHSWTENATLDFIVLCMSAFLTRMNNGSCGGCLLPVQRSFHGYCRRTRHFFWWHNRRWITPKHFLEAINCKISPAPGLHVDRLYCTQQQTIAHRTSSHLVNPTITIV